MAGPWERDWGDAASVSARPAPWEREWDQPRPTTRRRTSRVESGLSGAADAVTLGFGDEILAAVDATTGVAKGRDWNERYRNSVTSSRAYQRNAQEDNPLSYFGGQVAGSVVPGGAAMRGANALMQGSRGLRTLSAAKPVTSLLASGAAGGAVGGAVYGAGSAEEGNRLLGAAQGGAGGAVFGAAFAPVGAAVGSAIRSGRNALANAPRRNIMADVSGEARTPPGGPSANEFGRRAVADVERLARRQRMEPADIEAAVNAAEADPRGRVLADILGNQGRAKTRALTAAPGQTGQLAEDLIGSRARGQLGRLTQDVEGAVGAETGPQARNRIEQGLQEASDQLYQPTMGQEVSEEGLAAMQPVLDRFPASVTKRAKEVMADLAHTEGYNVDSLTSAERLHFYKRALSDTVQSMAREGLGADQQRAYTRLLREFTDQMDTHIPGYSGARGRWRELKGAEEALTLGEDAFKPSTRVEDIRARVAAMTPEQAAAMRAGLRDRIVENFMRANKEGRRNVAAIMEDTLTQEKLRAALGPDEAEKIINAIRTESDLFQSGTQMQSKNNSATAANAMNAMEDGLAAEMIQTARRPLEAPQRWAGGALNALLGQGVERRRDALGRLLLTSADEGGMGYDKEKLRRLLKVLAERQRRAMDRTRDQLQAGITGSVGTSSADEGY